MIWVTIVASVIIVAIAFAFLGIKILFEKNGKFPNMHIGGNKDLAKRGITCATTQDREAQKQKTVKVKTMDLDGDSMTLSC